VVALFEHGEHGQLAAPIVRDVLKAYFDKKDRLSPSTSNKWPRPSRPLAPAPGPWPPIPGPWPPSPAPGPRPPAWPRPPAPVLVMSRYLSPRDIDWAVLIIALFLCAVGALQIYSATRDTEFQSSWWKQIVYVLGGLVLMWIASAVDYHTCCTGSPRCTPGRSWRCWLHM